jgi:hypothetical protein
MSTQRTTTMEESEEYDFNIIETDSFNDQLECLSAVSNNNELICEEQQQDLRFNRVSSCFFSVRSGISSVASSSNDLLGTVIGEDEEKEGNDNTTMQKKNRTAVLNAVDVLYHDILMQVLSFLSPVDLVSFSETGRRANFECFYYLQLQIQRALQYSQNVPEMFIDSFGIKPLVGTATFSRLASVGLMEAEKLAQEFLDPHASLRTIPLSQRLECLRQAFLEASQGPADSANVRAGLFFTVFGGMCASYMGSDIHPGQALFSLGLGASLMKAAKDRHFFEKSPGLSQSCPEARSPLYDMDHPSSSDPYDHLGLDIDTDISVQQQSPCLRNPSGCVGSYMRIIRKSSSTLAELIKKQRCSNFLQLSEMDRTHLSTNFIDACSSDESLPLVKSIVTKHGIDVDAFYISSDGTETCALHCAAFNGACRILEFLCAGFDENDPENDGGLCNLNIQDSNGWTALHFAAGSNCLAAVRILSSHDADLTIEAGNGYTPYHWAERLNNTDVTAELEKLGAAKRFLSTDNKFSSLARSFFSNVIPA